jgi:signal transduction histidine kinase
MTAVAEFTPGVVPPTRLLRSFVSLSTFLFLFASRIALAADAHFANPERTLTSAAQILDLPAEVANTHLPATIRGVVTAAEPDWGGKFVIQDETAGLFVQNLGRQPAIGDLIEVSGVTGPGWFAPVLQSTDWKKLGVAPLPEAKPVRVERLMAGVEASQRIEITGLVRSVSYVPSQKTMVEVSIGGYRVRVFPKLPGNVNPRSLIAAKVRVRGTAATAFNAARRQLTAVNIIVPTAEDFTVLEPERTSPFEEPFVSLADIARYRPNATLGARVHVHGVLTFQRPGSDFFLQDTTGGLHAETMRPEAYPLGSAIEAVGFLEFVNYQPVLKDAIFREYPKKLPAVRGAQVPPSELRDGLHEGELVVLKGVIVDRSERPLSRESAGFAGQRVVFTVRHEEQSYIAEYEEPLPSAHPPIPIGSTVELTGVAHFEIDETGKPKTIGLLLPTPESIRVLTTPSWFTPERLLASLAVVTLLFAGSAVWLLTVTKKNAMLNFLVAEREKAQQELQRAHDQLEVRVKERTAQLKEEMTVRKSAEVEFRAVLTERTRLARELHDTLEQALTGIALQLDTTAKLFQRDPREAQKPLELAREFLHQSQIELRRSIWDLRSRELEQFDLAEALTISGRQIANGSNVSLHLAVVGERRRLPEIVEENLLRIAQEALTNVVKHSGATRVDIELAFRRDLVALEIRDNGAGFDPQKLSGAGDRHYGLLGMGERAKRLRGRLELSGAPGEGATVRVTLPLDGAISHASAPADAPTTVI